MTGHRRFSIPTSTASTRRRYRYTAPDGSVYLIDKHAGVQSVQCINGQSLSFDANGISHSDGTGVAFSSRRPEPHHRDCRSHGQQPSVQLRQQRRSDPARRYGQPEDRLRVRLPVTASSRSTTRAALRRCATSTTRTAAHRQHRRGEARRSPITTTWSPKGNRHRPARQ